MGEDQAVARVGLPAVQAPAAQDQEIDVWWGAYDPRALVPGVLVGLTNTLLVIILAWLLWRDHGLSDSLARWLAYYLNAFLWAWHLVGWGWTLASTTYRLTTQRLLIWHGFRQLPPPPVHLRDLVEVQVQQTPLEKYLGVGKLLLHMRGSEERRLLAGVRHPQEIAGLIRHTAARAASSA